jgi:DNA-binding beta-propeller fold protein YncE
VFVTTFDRERRIGVLYRMADGDIGLHAGGTPRAGARPLLVQPEGVAVDGTGHLYVADREQGVVLRLDPGGKVLDPRVVAVKRPRLVAVDGTRLWIGADADATAPWQPGPGEIWKLEPGSGPSLVLRGPLPASLVVGPHGLVFVADRHGAAVFVLTPEGERREFLRFTDGDAPRALAFAPVTNETRRIGIAGDLFISVIPRGAFQLNDVIRVSGPFEVLGEADAAPR